MKFLVTPSPIPGWQKYIILVGTFISWVDFSPYNGHIDIFISDYMAPHMFSSSDTKKFSLEVSGWDLGESRSAIIII